MEQQDRSRCKGHGRQNTTEGDVQAMSYHEALTYLKSKIIGSVCRKEKQTLEEVYDVFTRASLSDSKRWAVKIKDVVAHIEAGNYVYTRDDAKKLLNKRKYMTWIFCDDDSMQYAKKLTTGQYRLIQFSRSHPEHDSYDVHSTVITPADYFGQDGSADEELTRILGHFGYDSVQSVKDEYGAAADQILCECIFESLIPESDDTLSFTGTKEACSAYITEYIKNN
jgi:hypothetical protein